MEVIDKRGKESEAAPKPTQEQLTAMQARDNELKNLPVICPACGQDARNDKGNFATMVNKDIVLCPGCGVLFMHSIPLENFRRGFKWTPKWQG